MEKLRKQPKWTFTLDELKSRSPSAKDFNFEDEIRQKAKGMKFIVSVCTLLKLPAMTIYTASVYLHRFYLRYSLKRIHAYEGAAACVFLAAKSEETARRLKEVAVACTRVASKNLQLVVADTSRDLARWIDSVTYTEELLLEALYFDLEISSPYLALGKLITLAGISDVSQATAQATDFINDSCRTPLALMYSSQQIAGGALLWTIDQSELAASNESWPAEVGLDVSVLPQVVSNMSKLIEIARNGQADGRAYPPIGSA